MARQDKSTSEGNNTIARLTIHKFSCIRDMSVEFKRLTVFIGEQASGKSVTCKLFYFFTQAFRNVYTTCLEKRLPFDMLAKELEKEFRLIFPDSAWQNDAFSLTWNVDAKTIVVLHGRHVKKIRMQCDDYRELYESALNKLNSKDKRSSNVTLFEEEMFDSRLLVHRVVTQAIGSLNLPSVDYIPAGRSFFSTIQENVFALLSDNIGIDYFLRQFGRRIESRGFRFFRQHAYSSLREYKNILHGSYSFDGKEQWIVRDANHKVRLADASSGQQEVFPLLLLLNQFLHTEITNPRRVVIEEPEAHLFPTAQKEIVELLRILMQRTKALGFVITTHSPFILCCLNGLITKAKLLGNDVSAYHLHDGFRDDLYDNDLNLINAERFDNISTDIANG